MRNISIWADKNLITKFAAINVVLATFKVFSLTLILSLKSPKFLPAQIYEIKGVSSLQVETE